MLLEQRLGGWARGELERLGVPERDSLWVVQQAFTGPYHLTVLVRRRDKRPLVRQVAVYQQARLGVTVNSITCELPMVSATAQQVLEWAGLKSPSQCFVTEEEAIDA